MQLVKMLPPEFTVCTLDNHQIHNQALWMIKGQSSNLYSKNIKCLMIFGRNYILDLVEIFTWAIGSCHLFCS